MKVRLNQLASTSRGRSKNPQAEKRSKFLKMLFSNMSGEINDTLINGYADGDLQKFKAAWNKMTIQILNNVAKQKGKPE